MKNKIRYYIDKAAFRIRRTRFKLRRSWTISQFDRSLRGAALSNHEQVIIDAENALKNKEKYESERAYAESEDPLVRQGFGLKRQAELNFNGKYANKNKERIMIQVPDPAFSPAGYSIFTNLAECLDFMGVPVHILGWHEDSGMAIDEFKPTLFLGSDHASFLEKIDWEAIARYRESNLLKIGLSISLEEEGYGNTSLLQRLDWGKKHQVDFYYTFYDEAFIRTSRKCLPFFDAACKMLYLPFGANIMRYYPVAGFRRDIDFVLIASRKNEHAIFMKDIVKRSSGFIDGPGWKHAPHFRFNRDRDRYIYARAKVGLNVHLPEQIESACEVNERTYQLAACGVPQVVDHPKLLDSLFSKRAMFVADTPGQFLEYFEAIINEPTIGQERALLAQQEAFAKHTIFHRVESFLQQLDALR